MKVVCFDIGGVLAHVCPTWGLALAHAGVPNDVFRDLRLEAWSGLREYQIGLTNESEYLDLVSQFFSIPTETAKSVHNGILMGPTSGTFELIEQLNRLPVITACLSNTNELHWSVLTDSLSYPNIAKLQHKFASHIFGVEKPNPEIYQLFESKLGFKGKEIVFFEDSALNYKAAVDAGWDAIHIDPHGKQEEQILDALSSRLPLLV